MNVNRLREIGNPPAPPLAPEADLLRRTLDRAYDQRRAVEAGEISAYGTLSRRSPGTGRSAATDPFCGDCGAIRSPLASEPCRACGSTQPPDLRRLNPRARHMVGESPLR